MGRSVASCELRVASHAAAVRPRSASSLQPPASSLAGSRRGISLLEVLISMFVLLFGLMGVAAVFPVGNHFAGKGEQYDRGAALADQAFADLKARGMLKPSAWLYAQQPTTSQGATMSNARFVHVPGTTEAFNVTPTTDAGPGHAFVIDPMGTAAGWTDYFTRRPSGNYSDAGNNNFEMDLDVFPQAMFTEQYFDGTLATRTYGATNRLNPWNQSYSGATAPFVEGKRWPIRRLTLPATPTITDSTQPTTKRSLAEVAFRLHDDLANETPEQDDHPGMQRWVMVDLNATPTPKDSSDDTPLARSFAGNYSWIATIVPTAMVAPITVGPATGVNALQPLHSQFSSQLYDVSVAVFHKRDAVPSATSERCIAASLNIGGELVIHAADNADGLAAVDNAVKDLMPGQWVAVAGVHPTTGLFLLKWYKLLSLDDETVREQVAPGVGSPLYLRRAMVEGPDWPAPTVAPLTTVQNLRAIILPGVIGVSTQSLPMERN